MSVNPATGALPTPSIFAPVSAPAFAIRVLFRVCHRHVPLRRRHPRRAVPGGRDPRPRRQRRDLAAARRARGNAPWDAWTLEWATTTSPPAPYNFETVPAVASRRPLWDLKHPDDPDGPHE